MQQFVKTLRIRSWLQRGLVIILAWGALSNAIGNYQQTKATEKVDEGVIANWENRFVELKQELPIKQGTVGYVADFDVEGIEFGALEQETEYVLTQYTMAPIVLERSTDHEWIVGNLSYEAYQTWIASTNGQYEVTGFGWNVYLIHRLGQ